MFKKGKTTIVKGKEGLKKKLEGPLLMDDTLGKTEIIYPKNVRAIVAMDFT